MNCPHCKQKNTDIYWHENCIATRPVSKVTKKKIIVLDDEHYDSAEEQEWFTCGHCGRTLDMGSRTIAYGADE